MIRGADYRNNDDRVPGCGSGVIAYNGIKDGMIWRD